MAQIRLGIIVHQPEPDDQWSTKFVRQLDRILQRVIAQRAL